MPKNQTVGAPCWAHVGPTSASVLLFQVSSPEALDLEGPGCPCQMLLPLTEGIRCLCTGHCLDPALDATKLYIFVSFD